MTQTFWNPQSKHKTFRNTKSEIEFFFEIFVCFGMQVPNTLKFGGAQVPQYLYLESQFWKRLLP
jgi:hypothetical protein